MNLEPVSRNGRRKSSSRRFGREIRLWLPFLGLVCCYSLSATAIVVSERTTIESREERDVHFTISISSTSNESAAPGRMRGGAPRLP